MWVGQWPVLGPLAFIRGFPWERAGIPGCQTTTGAGGP